MGFIGMFGIDSFDNTITFQLAPKKIAPQLGFATKYFLSVTYVASIKTVYGANDEQMTRACIITRTTIPTIKGGKEHKKAYQP